MARPKINYDSRLAETLAHDGCTDDEIMVHLSRANEDAKVDPKIVKKRCGLAIEHGRAVRKRELRKQQFETAMGTGRGAAVMQIWLGKQDLGQADKVEAAHKQYIQIKGSELWESTFGTTPSKSVRVPKGVAEGEKSSQAVH